ncbi:MULTISPECIES: BatD family protein [Paraburkholderia]|nr:MULTISPECIES: BatD family protein [Paraburkholderia]
MKRFIKCFVMLMIWAMACGARADDLPKVMVRAHLEPAGAVVAGTQVKLVVDCLTTTWFTEAPDWPLFDVPGAFVTLPDENAVNLDETIDGVKWFGVSRAYRITPQAGKRFEVPSFAITLHPGGTTEPIQVKTPVLDFVATVPAGAQDMAVFFPAPQLSVTQTIAPHDARVRVGDVVTRTITQRATATESMLIPPVAPAEVPGLKRDAAQAATKNIVDDHAGLVAGERTDTVSYRVERSGSYRLPEITVEWWNTKTQRKEKIVLPAVSIKAEAVREKPLFGIPADVIGKGGAHRIIFVDGTTVAWGVACIAAVFALIWAWAPLVARWQAGQRALRAAIARYRGGEQPAWRALLHSARRGTQAEVIAALYRWLDRRADIRQPARVAEFREREGSDPGSGLADSVDRHYHGANAEAGGKIGAPQLHALRRALGSQARLARKRFSKRIAPLNRD